MKRPSPLLWSLLWPLLVGLLSLAITAWLWQHERQTQQRDLRSSFDFGLRQTATRIEERLTGYEQVLLGVRGLFEATDLVSGEGFSLYVDSQLTGGDFAGLRSIAYVPLLRPATLIGGVVAPPEPGLPLPAAGLAVATEPMTSLKFIAPVADPLIGAVGDDLWSEPVRQAAMLQARDSGHAALTPGLPAEPGAATLPGTTADTGFLLVMPVYQRAGARDTVAARRAGTAGWVFASFRIHDLMASLYGENAPGLDVRLSDGVTPGAANLLYAAPGTASASHKPRFEAQEYLFAAGRTWTLTVRSSPSFEQHYGNDSAQIIAGTGTGLSLVLALLTWQGLTGRARAEAAARSMTRRLRQSSERYRRIVDTADEGIWVVDSEGRTSFVNPKLQQMLGYGEIAMLGRRWTEFMDDAGRASLAALAAAGADPLRQTHAEHLDLRFVRRDGGELWASLSTSPVRTDSGQYGGALAMLTDITEHKRAQHNREQLEAQLRQSQKMEAIGTMAGGIAHDFNNLLAAILGNVALVRQDLGAEHPAALRLAQISQAAERGRSLVQQIAAFSRRQPPQRLNLPIRPVLEEAARLLRATLPTLVELHLRLCDSPLRVSADATQLQQVMLNLCTNAWHAMAGGTGWIDIALDLAVLDAQAAAEVGGLAPGPHAHVSVSDNGCGMDEATRLRIFEPFYTTKPVGKGTGLGLSVVHGIVVSHGGAITVQSTPGQGSRFDLYFPLATPVELAEADAAARVQPSVPLVLTVPAVLPGQGQGQHVLYVDDDPVMGEMVQALLQRAGYRVSCVDDPRVALARATSTDDPVDVLVSDFNMPEMSGLDLVHALHQIRPALPVVLSSGYVSEGLRSEAQQAGVRHLMHKEFTLEQLAGLVLLALSEANAGAGKT